MEQYKNLYLHKMTTQSAFWQRYTRGHLLLGDDLMLALAGAIGDICD